MIQILVEEIYSTSLQEWKSNAIYKFWYSKFQKLKMELKKTAKIWHI